MGEYNTRLGCQLSFNEEQEKDIVEFVEKLNASHKTGQFLGNLLRLSLDNPEIFDRSSGRIESGTVMKLMDSYNISFNRKQFMDNITKEVQDMKKKVDDIYNMSLKTYMLAQMGNRIGLETKSDNQLAANFLLERQLKELQSSLGVVLNDSVYASNKIDATHEKADEILEYIIESYTGIIAELRKMLETCQVPVQQTVVQQVPVQSVTPATNISNVTSQVVTPTVVESKPVIIQKGVTEESPEEDEIIDFGNADMSALNSFFGEL